MPPGSEDLRLCPHSRIVSPVPNNPTIHRNVAGGGPPEGNRGRTFVEECLMVATVKVELPGDDTPGVTDEGVKVHVAAFGKAPQARFTALSNPLEGVTATV